MSGHGSESFWYNIKTGEVEFGFMSPNVDRVGPFETREDAEHALEKLRANSEAWEEDDSRG
jgi:hypothetical protein